MEAKFTMRPWVWGIWQIFPEDRQKQKDGKPFWTLCELPSQGGHYDGEVLTEGPFGRKSLIPESIIETTGYECDGVYASEANARLIAAAPDLLAALENIIDDYELGEGRAITQASIAKARAAITGAKEGT